MGMGMICTALHCTLRARSSKESGGRNRDVKQAVATLQLLLYVVASEPKYDCGVALAGME